MTTHGFESLIARAADDSLAAEERATLNAHLALCADCRAELDGQREARAALVARPILPVRDLSAMIRARLDVAKPEHARPWIDLFNWRGWSLRIAPVAAALVVIAVVVVGNVTSSETADLTAPVSTAADSTESVASALYSADVSEDALLHLLLRANADDALTNYIPARQDIKK